MTLHEPPKHSFIGYVGTGDDSDEDDVVFVVNDGGSGSVKCGDVFEGGGDSIGCIVSVAAVMMMMMKLSCCSCG